MLCALRILWLLHMPSALCIRKWELSWWKAENLKHKYGFVAIPVVDKGWWLFIAVVISEVYIINFDAISCFNSCITKRREH